MKFYGKKFLRAAFNRKTSSVQETRDAILWEVLDNYTCRVKIQGSDEFIIAHYPRNWTTVPYWMKAGNAVRVLHRSGNRGYVEVIGEGRAIPTAVSGDSTPTETTSSDVVLTGCFMTADGDSMSISITSGTYRINGTTYALTVEFQAKYFDSEDPILFDYETTVKYYLTSTSDPVFYLDSAPASGYFRYDAFVVGEDGVVDYIKGTESTTPEKPAIPANHVLVGDFILLVGGSTTITQADIGRVWSEPYASDLVVNINGEGFTYTMPWVEGATSASVGISLLLKDQYENTYSGVFTGYLTQNSGGGEFSELSTFTGSTSIIWTRDQTVVDTDIVLFTIQGVSGIIQLTSIGMIIPQSSGV